MKNILIYPSLLTPNSNSAHSKQINFTVKKLANDFDQIYFICPLIDNNFLNKKAIIDSYHKKNIKLIILPNTFRFIRFFLLISILLGLRLKFLVKRKIKLCLFSRSIIISLTSTFFFRRVSVELHDLPKVNNLLFKLLNYVALKRINNIFVISPNLKEDLKKKYKSIIKNKIILRPLGSVRETDFNLNKDFNGCSNSIKNWLENNLLKVAYIGSLNKINNSLFADFVKGHPELNFLIIGGEESFFYKFINEYNIKKKIFFIPYTDDYSYLNFIMEKTDIFIISNPYELEYSKYTSPLKMWEYANYRKPILVLGNRSFLNGLLYTDAFLSEKDINSKSIITFYYEYLKKAKYFMPKFIEEYSSDKSLKYLSYILKK